MQQLASVGLAPETAYHFSKFSNLVLRVGESIWSEFKLVFPKTESEKLTTINDALPFRLRTYVEGVRLLSTGVVSTVKGDYIDKAAGAQVLREAGCSTSSIGLNHIVKKHRATMAKNRTTNTYNITGLDEYLSFPDDQQDGFQETQDGRPNGVLDKGSPYEIVPLAEEPSSSNWSAGVSSFFLGFMGRTNTKAEAEDSSSAGGTSRAGNRRSSYGGEMPEHSERSPTVIESKGVNGEYSRNFGDLERVPVRKEASANEASSSFREIVRLENHNRNWEKELSASLKKYYSEKMRADALAKDIRTYQEKVHGLYGVKIRAAAIEKENQEIQGKLEVLSLEKVRADNLEEENGQYRAELEKKERELGELQLKLQDALAAKELEVTEQKKLQTSLEDIRRENQSLNSWKLEQTRKAAQDTSAAGQFRSKVADLTYAKVQSEKKEQQLTNLIQEQTQRIEDLKQQNSTLVVHMENLELEAQNLRERLRDELQKLEQISNEVEELNQKLKPQVITAAKEAPHDVDQETREQALKVRCSALEQQVQSKELDTQSLSRTLSKLNERLRQCDFEIDDLKHQIQDWENQDSQELTTAPLKQYTGDSFLETEATPYLFDRAVQSVHEGAGIFARLLMKAMEQGKIDGMAVARNTFVRSISLGKGAPLKYVLEAITCKLLFQSFEHDCFDLQETSGFLDMEQQRKDNFRQYKYLKSIEYPEQLVTAEDSLFTYFCRMKLESLSAAIPEIESLVQEIISRTFDRSIPAEDTSTDVATYLASKLGSTFVKLALCVWQVHKLAFSFNPVPRIFRVSQSEKFVEQFMESVIFQESESEGEDTSRIDISRVDFMVVPGFFINRIVIRSRVFVVTKPTSSAF